MVQEAPSLYPQPVERTTPPGRGVHGYYRRLSDGWIITGAAWPSARADKEFKGFEFLSRMPTFVMTFGDNVEESSFRDLSGRKFLPHLEPWRLIMQHPEGPGLFPVSQIIAHRWHIRPPYREVRFKQLEGVKVYDLFCPECDKGLFASDSEQEAIENLRIHLTSRINDQHSYRPEDLRALGQEYGIDFFAPRRGRKLVRLESPVIKAQPEPTEVTPSEAFVCPDCGEEFGVKIALVGHRRKHKVAAPA